MDRGELTRLLTPVVMRLLNELPPYSASADLLPAVERLRKAGHPADVVSAVLTQARLRAKARVKFGEFAERMLFTEAGLEQATRLRVAAVHAGRYQTAGVTHVADLCCGIGGDALALAALGIRVTAVDSDEITAALAAYNLAPFETADVMHADAGAVDLSAFDAVFADPARRRAGHQSRSRLDPDSYSPPLDLLFGLLDRIPTGIKLGPGFPRDRIPDRVEAQWVSVAGDVVEMGLWSGALARDGVARAALLLDGNGAHELVAGADVPDVPVGPLGEYVHEPDGAVIRARLVGDLARAEGATTLSPGIAYLTSDRPADSPFLSSFQVRARLPLDAAELKRELRRRGIGVLEIKKRGVDLDPAAFRTRLGLQGPDAATLILTRVDGRHCALLADRA